MRIGIIGLPNCGKTTVFNALTGSQYATGAVSSGKLEVLTEVVSVPDPRIDRLSTLYKPKKTTYPTITFQDIGGLDKGSDKSGVSGQLRNALGPLDGFVHVIRTFPSETVPHPYTAIDPRRDMDIIESEFILSDLVTIERRLERLAEELKKGGKTLNKTANAAETELLSRLKTTLETETPLRDIQLSEEEIQMVRGYGLLSLKPVVLVFNVGEVTEQPETQYQNLHRNTLAMSIQGQIEAEIAQLDDADRALFLEEYQIQEPSSLRIIRTCYDLMHIQTFFTVGEDEVRGWSVHIGATAPEAAGVIHTDLQRGFIRAEVTAYADLIELGNMTEVKAKGKMRLEGKEYIIKDGDILNIRFNI